MPSEVPPYLQISDDLRRRIGEGEWRPGERLPSRAQLALAYGVGANVLQRAQERLIAEGLLEGRPGSGTYVRTPTERGRTVRSRYSERRGDSPFRVEQRERGRTGSWESKSYVRTPAPEHIARRLRIATGDLTVRTCYEYLSDGRPAQLSESWEPMSVTADTPVLMPELGPLAGRGVLERMASIGVVVDFAVEVPRPGRATAEQANLLGIPTGDLVTLIERTYFDLDGRAVETADIVVPDSKWEIAYEFPVEHW
ncbi:GntR family transcriptional regulator [Kitasatospora sp. NPDC057223]|jgi:GntR family transcriptional regulator|uniref:GntR family transcriptional regulator n=1 Tax=Kitasatospora sp. NPDC057223 TaxID=3346055 RepID=UPI00362BBA29